MAAELREFCANLEIAHKPTRFPDAVSAFHALWYLAGGVPAMRRHACPCLQRRAQVTSGRPREWASISR